MTSLKLSGFCFAVCVVLAVFLLLPSYSSALASHYTTSTQTVTVAYWNCYTYSYTYCYNYWYWNYYYWNWYWYPSYYYGYYWNPWYGYGYWRWCNSYQQTSCYYSYYSETRTTQVCESGWTGSLCNVPTCTPACLTRKVCVDLNKCACADGSTTETCQMVPCSPTNNCYPGTCVNGTCKCPPGFNGPNCLNFDHQPSITYCSVKLFAKPTASSAEIEVAQADCAAPGLTPPVTWINGPNLNREVTNYGISRIEPIWTAEYTFPTPMPSIPDGASTFYIKDIPVKLGVSDGGFNITFPSTTSNQTTRNIQCTYANLATTLPSTATCDVPTTWDSLLVNSLIGHNTTMIVNMYAVLGGAKQGNPAYGGGNYSFGIQQFIGTPVVIQSMLKFDLMSPTHCLLQQAGSITPGSNGRINCTIYPIYLDQDIRTNPVIKPLFLGWTDDGSGIRIFHIEVFYMQPDTSGEQLQPNGSPVTDSVADVTPKLNNYQFTVPTPGVYSIVVTAYDHANNSATARKIFNYMNEPSYSVTTSPVFIQEANQASNYTFITLLPDRKQLTLDWTGRFQPHPLYKQTLSKRVRPLPITQSTMDDIYGTQFGQRSINAVDNQTGISSYTVRYVVDSYNGGYDASQAQTNTTDTITGEKATLTFDTPLINGDTVVVWLTATGSTGNQTTYKLNVTLDTTRPNISEAMFVKNGVDQYASSLVLKVVDPESGINATKYTVWDTQTDKAVGKEQVAQAVTMLHPSKPRKKRDGTPAVCYPASDTTCYCTAKEKCFPYSQTISIDNCMLDKYQGDQSKVLRYWLSNNAGNEVSGSVKLGDLSGIYCRTPVLTIGAIIGIIIGCVIGFIILVLLVIFIVLIIIRIRQHKHPLPSRQEMRTYAGHVRNRFTMRKETHNEMYTSGAQVGASHSKQFSKNNNAYVEDDVYVDKDDLDSFKIPKKQIQLSETLAEGRFAVIRKAFFIKANTKDTVAAKALKNGFSQSDELLMTKKVSFMKNVPIHGNLVHFIGFIDEPDGQGPIMILELCDYPLKDWLANLSDISTDDLELMLNFTLNIAQGVAHLHTHKIIHRRLAVRNVLLKQQANGLVAKLIGFGPTAEDDKTDSAGTGVSVPLKWMAPETLDSMNSSKPVYNEKTDAWSYGVTVWEIYSKGDAPYPNVKSGDIKSQVKRGLRLQCPKDCPPDLFNVAVNPCWNENPKQRPAFNVIVNRVQEFRGGNQRPPSGYYGTDEVRGQELYTNREMYNDAH